MNRKNFNKALAFSAILPAFHFPDKQKNEQSENYRRLLPKRLSKGDTVGLITPGSAVSTEKLNKTLKNLEELGLNYKLASNALKKNGHLAGTDAERISDFFDVWNDDEIDAIWCMRGGYGTTRIVDRINFEIIRSNPKIFIGYSDITALHLAIGKRTGLVTFHGPVGCSEFNDFAFESFKNVLFEGKSTIDICKSDSSGREDFRVPYVLVPGQMAGVLTGGNLSLLSSLVGTRFEIKPKGKILLIEEIDEDPYRLDRMLTQLLNTTDIDQASGIILGVFKGCEKKDDDSYTLRETIADRLGKLGIPVFYGFSFGHVDNNCTIPLGVEASFDTEEPIIKIRESFVL